MSEINAYWQCRKCKKIITTDNPMVTTGYCPYCNEFHILERFDPQNLILGMTLEEKLIKIKALFEDLSIMKQFITDLNDPEMNQQILSQLNEMRECIKASINIDSADKIMYFTNILEIETFIKKLGDEK